MSGLLYYFIIYPLSLLPHRVLYFLSSILWRVLFYVVGYRKEVVFNNLKNSFPEKSEQEIKLIAKKFYRHLSDIIVESVKNFSISEKQARKRMITLDTGLLDKYYAEGRDVILAAGHFGNWELYAVGMPFQIDSQGVGIYKRLHNKFFEKKMLSSRTKFGLIMVPSKDTKTVFEDFDIPVVCGFVMDQSPGSSKKSYWMNWMNQDTAVFYGTEHYAKKYNAVVIYGRAYKPRRGYYEVKLDLITDDPNATAYGEITEKAMGLLEKDIKKEPHLWMWSHKRWKRRRDDGT